MPIQRRWIAAGIVLTGGLGLLAAAGLAAAPHTGRLTYTAPAGRAQNALTLRLSGPNLVLLDDATQAVLAAQPLAGTQGVVIQGAAGNVDDALTVDLSGGPLPLPDGIHFDGGAGGWDTLSLTGGADGPGSYTASGPSSGEITHAGTRIYFSNLEPISDSSPTINYIFNAPSSSDAISVTNGASCGAGCFTTLISSPSFESVTLHNKTNVTINGNGGADVFKLNNPNAASGMSQLVLDGGGDPGDAIAVTSFGIVGGTLSFTDAVTVTQSGGISVTNLAVDVVGPVSMPNLNNHVAVVAGRTSGSAADINFASSAPTLTVGVVNGLAGVIAAQGAIQIEDEALGGALVVNSAIQALAHNITLFGDQMSLNATVNAGAGTVSLDNWYTFVPINLGSHAPSTLGLLPADLNQVTAFSLIIGNSAIDTGGLTISAPLTSTAGWHTLDLRQNAPINETGSGRVTVTDLAVVTTGDNVDLTLNPNHVAIQAANTLGGNYKYFDGGSTTIGAVDGTFGVTTSGGAVDVTARAGGLILNQPVKAGAGAILLNASESASTSDDVTISPGVLVSSTAGNINLLAGDHITLGAGSVVETGGAGNVFLQFSFSDTDNRGGASIAGTLASPGHTVQAQGGAADDTLLLNFTAGAALPDGLSYNGGTGQNALTMSDAGGGSAHRYDASGTGMTRDLASIVQVTQVQIETATGGNAADAFAIQPNPAMTFHVNGGLPGSAPGDNLFVTLLSVTSPTLQVTAFDANGLTGQWTFGNRLPVNFTGIDSFVNLNHALELPLLRR